MAKNLLKKIVVDEDLKETGFNMATMWVIGNIANIVSNSVFHFDLDCFNSVKHLVTGVGIGTITYRKANGGIKGFLAGSIAACLSSLAWEYFENNYVFHNNHLDIDTISDIAMVYAGATLSFVAEELKNYINPKEIYPQGKEKWAL